MRQSLREIAEHLAVMGIVLLGEQPEIVRSRYCMIKNSLRIVDFPLTGDFEIRLVLLLEERGKVRNNGGIGRRDPDRDQARILPVDFFDFFVRLLEEFLQSLFRSLDFFRGRSRYGDGFRYRSGRCRWSLPECVDSPDGCY